MAQLKPSTTSILSNSSSPTRSGLRPWSYCAIALFVLVPALSAFSQDPFKSVGFLTLPADGFVQFGPEPAAVTVPGFFTVHSTLGIRTLVDAGGISVRIESEPFRSAAICARHPIALEGGLVIVGLTPQADRRFLWPSAVQAVKCWILGSEPNLIH